MAINARLLAALVIAGLCLPAAVRADDEPSRDKIKVVTTSSAYAPIAQYIGGDLVEVSYIVEGYQDPHIVRPKPSYAVLLNEADLFIATGLDLEAWVPALLDMANNPRIRSGQPGYVAASAGLDVLEKPDTPDRSEGDVHVYGNPHIHTSPLNGKIIAENITVGLKRIAGAHAAVFDANLARFKDEIDRRLFGDELVELLGGKVLTRLAQSGKLHDFLQKKSFEGRPLSERLGGWMKLAEPLRGRKIVTYHKNWSYLVDLFGIDVVGFMEPKPGIPPSPGHVSKLIDTMRSQNVTVVLAANYFDRAKVGRVADKTGARPIIVALAARGEEGMDTFFDQFDVWLARLRAACVEEAAR